MSGLSAYERAREAQIARNKQEIKRIGLAASRRRARASAPAASSTVKRKRRASPAAEATKAKAAKRAASVPLRRSKRGVKTVDYTRERVDTSATPDTSDEIREQYKKKKKKQTADVLAECAAWLQRHRASLADQHDVSVVPAASGRIAAENDNNQDTWRAIARDKWGDGVLMSEKGARQTMVDWEMFVLSRSSTTPPQVPDGRGLLQEKYADCPWKLLISCVLMSRVSSASVKCKAIEGFFSKFPTPTAVLASKPNDVYEIIKPLGLFPGRHRSVVEISTRFLTMIDQPFAVGLQPELKIYGVGAFGVDSYNIFCKCQTSPLPMDKNLAGYCRWVNNLVELP